MKLLFVFTGGTIGSTQSGDFISVDKNKSYLIIDAYRARYEIDFEYDALEPYTELSEYADGWHIRNLVSCIKQNKDNGYDGIIVAHGSDTLQYSAAAIGYCLGNESLPICVVAANKPIEDSKSNALDNLHGAISFIKQGAGSGTFVVYRNANSDTVRVHRATRLIASMAYSDEVLSVGDLIYGSFDGNFNFFKNKKYSEKADEALQLCELCIEQFSNNIMILPSYPAMIYPKIPNEVKYVMLNTYHSGTLNTKSQALIQFLNEAKTKNVKVYATGIASGAQYSSAKIFDELGIIPLKNLSPVSAYVKLWLLSSMKKAPEELTTLMNKSIGGDIAY